jgi:hypothetical protein
MPYLADAGQDTYLFDDIEGCPGEWLIYQEHFTICVLQLPAFEVQIVFLGKSTGLMLIPNIQPQ